ncbi:MAG: copper chaperone PCu(A)C, partial [Rhodospirillales bacterium]
ALAGDITIENAWARATPPGAKVGGAFLTIVNAGETDRLLTAAAAVSDVVELHTHIHDNGIMRMRQVEAIDTAPGRTELKPGGLHIMFIGLKEPLTAGSHFPVTLTFEKAGALTLDMPVAMPGEQGTMQDMKKEMDPAKHQH